MTAQIISFESLSRDVQAFSRGLLSPSDAIQTCLIESAYPRHPIILTESTILKFVLHQFPSLIAVEVIPFAKVHHVIAEKYANKATITAYHRDVIIIDSQGHRFVEAITSQGVKPIVRNLESSRADPREDHDLIGFFVLPEEENILEAWALSVDTSSPVSVEWRRGSRW